MTASLNEPWKSREDWARGIIPSAQKSQAKVLIFMAAVFNLFSCFMLWMAATKPRLGPGEIAVVAFWVLMSLGLAAAALHQFLVWRKFGRSVLVLETIPGVVGGQIRATVKANVLLELRSPARVTLSCAVPMRKSDMVLWQEETLIHQEAFRHNHSGTLIPVAFNIPADGRPTEIADGRTSLYWMISVSAEAKGADYQAAFHVPVFKSEELLREQESVPLRIPPPLPVWPEFLAEQGIRWQSDGASVMLRFGPARHPKLAAAGALMLLAFVGVTLAFLYVVVRAQPLGLMQAAGALMVGLILASLDFLMLWGTLSYLFGTIRIRADREKLSFQSGFLGIMGGPAYPSETVASIQTAALPTWIGTLYNLKVFLKDGGSKTLTTLVREKHEAEWIAREVFKALTPDDMEPPPKTDLLMLIRKITPAVVPFVIVFWGAMIWIDFFAPKRKFEIPGSKAWAEDAADAAWEHIRTALRSARHRVNHR